MEEVLVPAHHMRRPAGNLACPNSLYGSEARRQSLSGVVVVWVKPAQVLVGPFRDSTASTDFYFVLRVWELLCDRACAIPCARLSSVLILDEDLGPDG